MRITAFQSGQGDCLLLSSFADRTRILVDGGMPGDYTAHVAPALGRLRLLAKKNIDLVYVSHIDRDHIGGVLRMLDDEALWRVHRHLRANGNPSHPPPEAPRPPELSAIWHNAFFDQLERNAEPIAEALAASAPVLSAAELLEARNAGQAQAGLVSSIADAIRVSSRIGLRQLKIPLNAASGGRLLLRRAGQAPIQLGRFRITILGPTEAQLKKLRDDWNTWLQANGPRVEQLRQQALIDERSLGANSVGQLKAAMRLQAEAFGDPKSVTPPNLASLTLLVEEGPRSILLTGDARWDHIIEGLEATGRLTTTAPMAVDVVKVPHHGSENNVVETTLLDRVIGTHYVFCGNGHSTNPEVSVVELMARRRLKAPGMFKFWFNSSEQAATNDERRDHMRRVEQVVRQLAAASGGRMRFKFLQSGSSVRVL